VPEGLVLLQAIAYWEASKTDTFDSAAFLREVEEKDFYTLVGVSQL
jgi:hypothetical protein